MAGPCHNDVYRCFLGSEWRKSLRSLFQTFGWDLAVLCVVLCGSFVLRHNDGNTHRHAMR